MVVPSHLKSLQALELAVRKGSFRLAGEILGITPAAVGQRVKVLEDYLGIELLVRGRAGVRATPELRSALPHLRQAFVALDEVSTELDLQRGHELHIACVSDFAELWLKPRFERFRQEHPHLAICINGEGDAPIRIGRVDCEIGYGPIREDDRTVLLFRDFIIPLTSPENLQRTSNIPAAQRLEGFPLVHVGFYKDDPAKLAWPEWIAANHVVRTNPEFGTRFRRIAHALDAIRADVGFALCGIALLADALDDETIAPLYPASTGRWSEHGFVATFRTEAPARNHVARFRSWLMAESDQTREWLAKRCC